MHTHFKLLKQVNRHPGINQRTLSKQCDISLGKVNTLVEELEYNNYIEKECVGREHRYFITSTGLDYLEQQLKVQQNDRLELPSTAATATTAVILAAGRNTLFDLPLALCKIDDTSLINRTIDQLKAYGISNIIVVVGYMSDYLKSKLDPSITCVENPNYKWTGTMASLAAAGAYINEDFLLIESDIVIEDLGIKELIQSDKKDCMLITTESGSGDEAFVELKDESIFKISKDICQLNKIDGEMIGVSKLSYAFFRKMLEAYAFNQNPYMNYEYMMLDISRQYTLNYLKIDSLLWHEIDTPQHLEYVIHKLLPKIIKKETSLKLQNLRPIICEVLKVSDDQIQNIAPIGGMTNKNYKITINNEHFVLRVPGNGTEEMISRHNEMKNAFYAHEVGVDAELIYFNEETGIKVSRFIDNAETLSPDSAKRHANMKLTTSLLRKLHSSTKPMPTRFDVYNEIEKYHNLVIKYGATHYEDYETTRERVYALQDILETLDVKLTPCHNDLVAENLIKSGEDKMYLIDWEYAGMNDPMWDLAAHIIECGFSEEDEARFLNLYFNGEPEEKYIKRVLINKIFQDFLWSIWTIVKEAKGDNFGCYGINRYNRARANLDKILN
ncbi:MAG: phosphotransferase [Zhenhengia sp.]|uniref:phosphotransferase n=1 Tax=Zhenhengia sp. TaxID=2944208 RepID=UPI003994C732